MTVLYVEKSVEDSKHYHKSAIRQKTHWPMRFIYRELKKTSTNDSINNSRNISFGFNLIGIVAIPDVSEGRDLFV